MCVGSHVQRDFNARKSTSEQKQTEQVMVQERGQKKEYREQWKNPKDNPKEPKVSKPRIRVKTSKTGLSGLENSKSEISSETQESAQTCPTDNSWIHDRLSLDERNDGLSFDEWNDDWSSGG